MRWNVPWKEAVLNAVERAYRVLESGENKR